MVLLFVHNNGSLATLFKTTISILVGQLLEWVTSTNNRLYVGWFGVLMIPTLLAATICFVMAFVVHLWTSMASVNPSPVHSCTVTTSSLVQLFPLPTQLDSTSIPSGKARHRRVKLYNGGPFQLVVFHFLIGICAYMGREWELSYRLGMRPGSVLLHLFAAAIRGLPGLSFRSRFFL